jgi:hypothetical protein
MAVRNPCDWTVYVGIAEQLTKDSADSMRTGALTVELPTGRMMDGPNRIASGKAFSTTAHVVCRHLCGRCRAQ